MTSAGKRCPSPVNRCWVTDCNLPPGHWELAAGAGLVLPNFRKSRVFVPGKTLSQALDLRAGDLVRNGQETRHELCVERVVLIPIGVLELLRGSLE
jgi:hypothetical protein